MSQKAFCCLLYFRSLSPFLIPSFLNSIFFPRSLSPYLHPPLPSLLPYLSLSSFHPAFLVHFHSLFLCMSNHISHFPNLSLIALSLLLLLLHFDYCFVAHCFSFACASPFLHFLSFTGVCIPFLLLLSPEDDLIPFSFSIFHPIFSCEASTDLLIFA